MVPADALFRHAAGFFGSRLDRAVPGAREKVVGIDPFTDHDDSAWKPVNAATHAVGDAGLVKAAVDAFLDGAAGLFHLSGQPGVGSWRDAFRCATSRRSVPGSGRASRSRASWSQPAQGAVR
jgi:nucleoside-diphosphate-sugar epimerase